MLRDGKAPDHGRGSLGEVAYDGIRQMILGGELAPGDRVLEKDCAERLGISRTPVREAIGRLTSEGLISRSGSGVPIVIRVTADDILEILHIRRLLEIEAARRACDAPGREVLLELRRGIVAFLEGDRPDATTHRVMDDRLHETLAHMARSQILQDMIANLRLRTRVFDKAMLPDRFEPGCREHLEILDAVIHGDPDRAEVAMRTHLNAAADSILDHLKRNL
jgi:DNA-binding GntR family transcriptional regulator